MRNLANHLARTRPAAAASRCIVGRDVLTRGVPGKLGSFRYFDEYFEPGTGGGSCPSHWLRSVIIYGDHLYRDTQRGANLGVYRGAAVNSGIYIKVHVPYISF